MNDQPPDQRGVSPVASKRRLFRSARSRGIALGAGGIIAVGLTVLGVNAVLHDQGPVQKPVDTGSSVIAQVTQTPPPAPDPAPAKPAERPVAKVISMQAASPAPSHCGGWSGQLCADADQFRGSRFRGSDPEESGRRRRQASDCRGCSHCGDDSSDVQAIRHWRRQGRPGYSADLSDDARSLSVCAEHGDGFTIAGAITCHTTQDILSPDHVLLMAAGTQITGTYKNDIRQGQSRLFAFAGYAITKEGIPVPLDSQVADGLGRSGIEGNVDNHFFERFGAGILGCGITVSPGAGTGGCEQGRQFIFESQRRWRRPGCGDRDPAPAGEHRTDDFRSPRHHCFYCGGSPNRLLGCPQNQDR